MSTPEKAFLASGQDAASLINSINALSQGQNGSVVPTYVNTNTQSNSNLSQQDLINQLIALTSSTSGNTFTQGAVTTDNLTTQQKQQLDAALTSVMAQLSGPNPYSQEAANAASEGAAAAALSQVLQQGIGKVAQSGVNQGAYNSTVTGKLGSQLGAEAAKASESVKLNTLAQFGQLDNARNQTLVNNLNSLLATAGQTSGVVSSSQNTATDQQTSSNQSTKGKNTSTQTSDTSTNTQQNSEYANVGKQQGALSGVDDFVSSLFG